MKNKVQEMRWKRNWSQAQLAYISGVRRQTIQRIELGMEIPYTATALKLSRALKVEVSELFEI